MLCSLTCFLGAQQSQTSLAIEHPEEEHSKGTDEGSDQSGRSNTPVWLYTGDRLHECCVLSGCSGLKGLSDTHTLVASFRCEPVDLITHTGRHSESTKSHMRTSPYDVLLKSILQHELSRIGTSVSLHYPTIWLVPRGLPSYIYL